MVLPTADSGSELWLNPQYKRKSGLDLSVSQSCPELFALVWMILLKHNEWISKHQSAHPPTKVSKIQNGKLLFEITTATNMIFMSRITLLKISFNVLCRQQLQSWTMVELPHSMVRCEPSYWLSLTTVNAVATYKDSLLRWPRKNHVTNDVFIIN